MYDGMISQRLNDTFDSISAIVAEAEKRNVILGEELEAERTLVREKGLEVEKERMLSIELQTQLDEELRNVEGKRVELEEMKRDGMALSKKLEYAISVQEGLKCRLEQEVGFTLHQPGGCYQADLLV